jgi:hypothetical protein
MDCDLPTDLCDTNENLSLVSMLYTFALIIYKNCMLTKNGSKIINTYTYALYNYT